MNIAIIQARLNSTRLPGKALMDLHGKPLLQHVIDRAKMIRGIDEVIVNVPLQNLASFQGLINGCWVRGVDGQEKDVLASFLTIAEEKNAKVIMRLTGDCPLLDPHICGRTLRLFQVIDDPLIYCANDTLRSGYPDGTDCEVFSVAALRFSAERAKEPYEREHVTIWMRRHLPNYGVLAKYGEHYQFNIMELAKFSVDTKLDYERVSQTMAHLDPEDYSLHGTWRAYQKSRGAHGSV